MATLNLSRAALVLIDIQKDFVHPNGLFATKVSRMFDDAGLGAFLTNCAHLVDAMHGLKRPVIFIRVDYRVDGADSALAPYWAKRLASTSDLVIENSWGAEFMDELLPAPSDIVITKKSHSAFHDTHLDRVLRNLKIEQCIYLGGAIGGCLTDTVHQGAALGYDQFVVTDAVYPPNSPSFQPLKWRSKAITTDELLAAAKVPMEIVNHQESTDRSAVLLIDFQNDFVHPEGALRRLRPQHNPADISAAVDLVDTARKRSWPVVFCNLTLRADGLDSALASDSRLGTLMKERKLAQSGTWGAAPHDQLRPQEHDFVVSHVAHSAFAFTPLDHILRKLGVTRCYVMNGNTPDSLNDTVREAAALGYETVVVGAPVSQSEDQLTTRAVFCTVA